MLTPVRRLAQAAERMSGGDLSVRVQPRGRGELARLVASFNEMARGLEGKVAELQRMEASSARARSEGSGLGLAIAWENARLHGGRIDAGNHPDGGAVFTVILPVRGLIAAGMTAGTLPGIRR